MRADEDSAGTISSERRKICNMLLDCRGCFAYESCKRAKALLLFFCFGECVRIFGGCSVVPTLPPMSVANADILSLLINLLNNALESYEKI